MDAMTEYVFDVDDDTAEVGRYPADQPYETIDQGSDNPDRILLRTIIAMRDVAAAGGLTAALDRLSGLWNDAASLFTDGSGWSDDSEQLTFLYEQAEQVVGISVNWVADTGMVEITLTDKWEGIDEEEAGE